MMDHTEVSVEASEATSKSAYFASQAKSTESKEWANELVQDGDRKARAVKRSETFKADQRFFHDTHGEGSVVSRTADGVVEMKFDNGEVHKYDLISQRKLRPIIEDAHTYTAEVLFDIVDTDSSGVLEKAEFVYMHTMVLNSEKRAAAKIADAERNEAEQRRAKRLVMWALLVAVLMIFVLLGGMLGIAFAANEATKESHVNAGTGEMKSVSGERVTVSVTETQSSIYDIAFLDTEELAHMSFLVALVDKRADPDHGALMEYSFKIATTGKTASLDGTDACELETANGHVIKINGTARTAEVAMGGGAYPLLENADGVEDELRARRLHPRRGMRRGGGISARGTFALSSARSSNTEGN